MIKSFALVLMLGLTAVACSKKSGDAAGGGDACATSIGKAIEAMMAGKKDGPPEMAKQMAEVADKLRGVMVSSCNADKWSPAVLDCFAEAKDQPSIKKCRGQLPPEQAQKLQSEILKVMSGGMGGMRPPHGAGGPMGGPGPGAPGGDPAAAGSAAPPAPPAGSADGSAAHP